MKRSVLRELPRPVWILLAAVFINRVGVMVVPMLALYLRELGFSESQAIFTSAFYAVGATLAAVPAGVLADRFGRRNTIVLVMSGSACAILLLPSLRQPALLVGGVFLVGLFAESYRPAVSAMLADLVTPENRVPAFALQRTMVNAGHALGPLLAGFLAAAHHFGALFWIDGGTALLFALICAFGLPETRPQGPRPPLMAFQSLRDRRFRWFCLGLLPVAAGYFQVLTTLPIHLRDFVDAPSGGLWVGLANALPERSTLRELLLRPQSVFGVLMSVNAVVIVCCEFPLSLRLRHFATHKVIALGAIVTGIGLALFGVLPSWDGALLAILVATLGEMLFMPSALFYVADVAPPESRAQYMAVFGLVHGVALVLAPLLGGAGLPSLGPRWYWILVGGAAVLAALSFARTRAR